MKKNTILKFDEVWFVDFEFSAPPGERPVPICMVAWEFKTDRKLKIWQDKLQTMPEAPYSTGQESLFVAYYSSAEIGCHLALNWDLPRHILDLFVEFRNINNGLPTPCGYGLAEALIYFGMGSLDVVEKENMRNLALRGGPYTHNEKEALMNYCESDVKALYNLFIKMVPIIDIPRALIRGRYMKAAAQIEYNGIPIDKKMLNLVRENWEAIQKKLIMEVDDEYGVFVDLTFKIALFERWLIKKGIPWPRLESGTLDLSDETFKEMAKAYPEVTPIRELRVSLSQMRLSKLAVGSDGRNRVLLSAFSARTSRNQPSNSQFIFGPAVWLRGLIKPRRGYGLAYIDWSQQEFGIAAVLSGDERMKKAYLSGDPYLEFAKQAGAVPYYATKDSHQAQRDQFKACALAVQYGMGFRSLAQRINRSANEARYLLEMHHRIYKKFWDWSDGVVDHAMLYGRLWTVFGWTIQVGNNPNPRSFRNFPMQANGAEMLRLACCFAVERGVKVCAPIHDAILIEFPLDTLDSAIMNAQKAMSDASAIVLDGFRLRTDVKTIKYPERYQDKRGQKMWALVEGIIYENFS